MIQLYILYDAQSGEIIRASSSPISSPAEGLSVIQETVEMGELRYLSVINGSLTVGGSGLTLLKQDKWQSIKQQRDSSEFSGFTWDGSTFDSDQISQSRIQGAVQLASMSINAEQPFSIEWTLADNSTRILSAEQMLAVGVALSQHVSLQHSKARLLRSSIESCETKEELENITW